MNEIKNALKDKELKAHFDDNPDSISKVEVNKYFPILKRKIDGIFTPKNLDQFLSFLKIAIRNNMQLIPMSSIFDFHGSTSTNGGVICDLRSLNEISKIRGSPMEGMSADIQPGVTFRQLNEKLKSYNMRVVLPLRLPADTSVLSCYYGRNPLLESNKYEQHQDWRILTYQIALAKKRGIIIGLGSEGLETGGDPGDYPYSPRCDLGRMLLGAIGAFGFIMRITPKLKFSLDKLEILYAYGDDLMDLLNKVRKTILATDAAEVAMIGSSRAIAGYLSCIKNEYDNFLNKLPRWTAILAIGGEQELIDVEKADLTEYGTKNGLSLGVEPLAGMTNILKQEFRVPENVSKSFDIAPHLRIEFYTTANSLNKIQLAMEDFFKKNKIDESQIGFITNSLEMGRTYFCEYQLHYNMKNGEIDENNLPNVGDMNLKDLYKTSYKRIIELGGIINIPRNKITAELLYPLNPNYYELLRVLKYTLDPKNIMHPQILFNGDGGIDPKTIQIEQVV